MLIPDINSIHEIVPPIMIGGLLNRQLPAEEMIFIRTRGVSLPDQEELDRQFAVYAATHNPEERVKEKARLDHNLARSKFVELCNYQVNGPEGPRNLTTFDEFVKCGAPEVVAWYFAVIQSSEKLSLAERRNFLPPAASPSGSRSGEAAHSGSVKTAKRSKRKKGTATT